TLDPNPGNFVDMAYDPVSNLFWGGIRNSDDLFSFDASGTTTIYNDVLPESVAYGAAFADSTGGVSLFANQSGNFYSVNTSDGSVTLLGSNITTSTNDGAADTSRPNSLFATYIALDPDNSAGVGGTNSEATYSSGGSAVGIVDGAVDIDDLSNAGITQIEIVIQNPASGDALTTGSLPGSVTASNSTNALGQPVITLTGPSATVADFESAVAAVNFSNSTATPDNTPRFIDVSITNGNNVITSANSTIYVSGGTIGALADQTSAGAAPDQAQTNEGTIVTINLTGNDSDGATSISSIVQPVNGTVIDNGDGTVTFNPGSSFDGLSAGETAVSTFNYTSNTGSTGVVNVTVFGEEGNGSVAPVVIDIDGDGVEFNATAEGIALDVDGDGQREQTAWANEDDAVLIYDANGNGDVDGREEFAFADYATDPNATDMEGLAEHFDTNQDGILDANDQEWNSFRLWQDANGNGNVDEGEMIGLDEAGIQSIGVVSDGEAYSAADGDVTVHGESQVTYTDGSTGIAADAEFAYDDSFATSDLEVTSEDGTTLNLDSETVQAPGECVDCIPPADEPSSGTSLDDDILAANSANHF
ncbi:MAG: hypothetical protein AAF226_09440, partial [Verrucomicrobiota bacterium]